MLGPLLGRVPRPRAFDLLLSTLIAGVILSPAFSGLGEETLVRFRMQGPGSVFNTEYVLRTDGVLETSRYALTGKLLERRRRVLQPTDDLWYRDLLEQGGYFTADPEDLRLPEVQNKLGAVMDLPSWKVEVYRSGSETIVVDVPARYVGEFFPELSAIRYVTAAWQLLEEFQASWDDSQRVES